MHIKKLGNTITNFEVVICVFQNDKHLKHKMKLIMRLEFPLINVTYHVYGYDA